MITHHVEAPRTPRAPAEAPLLAGLPLAISAPMPVWPRRPRLIGRDGELALLMTLVDQARATGTAMLIRGAPGSGKSALVSALVAELPDRAVAVLLASGIRAEANLPYAGLHQLLRPVLGELGSLPPPQQRAIEAAFGIVEAPAPDPFLIAIATLNLLSMAARPSLVVVVEDAQWLDRRTSKVLSFVARRLSSDPIVLLVTTRDNTRCPILDAGLAELHLNGPDVVQAGQVAGADPWRLAITAAGGSPDMASGNEAAASSDPPDAAADVVLAGIASAIVGDLVRSRSLLARAAPMLQGEGDRGSKALLEVMQAWNDIHLGRWADAASSVATGAELARETGQEAWSVVADVVAALLAAMRGDEDQVEGALARVGPATVDRGNRWVASTVEVVRGISDLSAGRPEAAFTRLRDGIGAAAQEAAWAVDYFADAAVVSGHVDEARAVVEASGGEARGRRGALHVAAQLYASTVLADDETADEQQCQAMGELADWPIHQARLQLHRGRWLRRHRRVADSRAPLRAARDRFEAIGAGPLAEFARRELRASGERIRRRDVTAWDQLSPQETQIAHLAAEGLSNREIGEQLFLSHRTVGAHLYRIFPKLGVTTRGQLHRVLAPSAAG